MQQVGLALDVVGKKVTALDVDGRQITGSVDAVRFLSDGPVLTVAGVEIPLADVLSVETSSYATPSVPSPGTGVESPSPAPSSEEPSEAPADGTQPDAVSPRATT